MNKKNNIIDFLGLIFGCILISLGINIFFKPNNIAPGGLSGLSVIISNLIGVQTSIVMLSMGIPLLIFSIKILGKKDSIKTFIGMMVLSLCLTLTNHLSTLNIVEDILLSSIYGALFLGFGLGIVFRVDGSTGGTDLIALILHRIVPGVSIANFLVLIDGIVVLSSGIINKNVETALYSAISLYIIVKVIDAVIEGFNYSKAFTIITTKENEIRDIIVNDIKRGVTILSGKGGYTSDKKSVLLVVVKRNQEVYLKKLIRNVDKNAFIIVSEVHEVLGEGFKEDFLVD